MAQKLLPKKSLNLLFESRGLKNLISKSLGDEQQAIAMEIEYYFLLK